MEAKKGGRGPRQATNASSSELPSGSLPIGGPAPGMNIGASAQKAASNHVRRVYPAVAADAENMKTNCVAMRSVAGLQVVHHVMVNGFLEEVLHQGKGLGVHDLASPPRASS